MKLHSRQKHRAVGPRLERRNAIKNIDYDASTSTSPSSSLSSSYDNQSAPRTRSLDISSLADRTSFRIEGTEGEFDLICRRLGLSGPEDFAIPAADYKAHKSYSPRVCKSNPVSIRESAESDLFSVSFERKVSLSDDDDDDEVETDGEIDGARVLVINGSNKLDDDVSVDRVNNNRSLEDDGDDDDDDYMDKACERRNVEGESGIKGVRPPLLAPPPVMSLVTVDDSGSNWDLIRSFAPGDNEDLESDGPAEAVRPIEVGVVETNGMITTRIDTVVSPSSVGILDNEDESGDEVEDERSSGAVAELQYFVSPNGTLIGSFKNWQKGDLLGSGSFGTVYEGFNEFGFFFAVKEVSLLDQGNQGKQSIIQLEQEISLLSQFHHENIVRYLGTDKDDGKLYIFLELVTKGSLAKLYQKYDLRDSQVSAYTRQILSGLKYLHDRKVVHRDIKCANILVDVSGSVKLADFGLAKATTLNDIKSCKGTPYWMAPEVVNNRSTKGYGLAADIWSLGCTVLEMLTRKIPYYHLEGMQALFRIGRGEPPEIPNTLSAEAHDFILKCLQVNPNDRPTAAQLLDHPFLKRSTSMDSSLASPHNNSPQL
ncbi:mitogen-activated protein kinase kinase kinase 1-like [Rutidosis leptorrhynchoides]|uniref:mitogen-activated protein kinase kinase kinase 1-like n=1 Tax=Rutidosis leptorrhynchoides TaxID=125765 RepID=UPI003A99DB48